MKTDDPQHQLLNDVLFERRDSVHKQATRDRCLAVLRRRRSTIVRLRYMTLAAAACLVVGFAVQLLITSDRRSVTQPGNGNAEAVLSEAHAGLPPGDRGERAASRLKMIVPRSGPAYKAISTRLQPVKIHTTSQGGRFKLIRGADSNPVERMPPGDIEKWLPNVSFALMTSDRRRSELYLPSEADRKRLFASSP